MKRKNASLKPAKKPATKKTTTKKTGKPRAAKETARVLSSKIEYKCPLFTVKLEKVVEPDGRRNVRQIIRHNGSVVILALDTSKSKTDPWVVIERQYRHAANQYLWELPAGKIDEGEEPLAAAQRELAEETGYRAKKWRPLVEYFASPGFLGEAMKVFVAEGLEAGLTNFDEDEEIEVRLVRFKDLLKKIEKGEIVDGKTLISTLLYAHQRSK